MGGALIERLRREGWDVRALARSERAAERVRELGAEPVMGDLDDLHIEDCEIAFHAAAKVEDFGDPADFERVNVQGTRNVVAACRAGGVRRLVHVGTEAALMAGQPLVNVDESAPLRPDSPALYPSSKARAEQVVRAANGDGLETVVVRPRFVWGRGDTTPAAGDRRDGAARAASAGSAAAASSPPRPTSTTPSRACGSPATRGPAGGVWFVTDGEPVEFREFLTALVGTQGVEIPDKSVPRRRGERGRARRGGAVAPPEAARHPAAHPLRRLGLLSGVHDRHLARRARARLPARHDA